MFIIFRGYFGLRYCTSLSISGLLFHLPESVDHTPRRIADVEVYSASDEHFHYFFDVTQFYHCLFRSRHLPDWMTHSHMRRLKHASNYTYFGLSTPMRLSGRTGLGIRRAGPGTITARSGPIRGSHK